MNNIETRKATFIMVDGIDGSGKGFVVDCLEGLLKSRDFNFLDIRKIGKTDKSGNYFPEFDSIKDKYNTLIFMEPSDVGVGLDLRSEIFVRSDRHYSVKSQAMAFSLQREIIYKRLLINEGLNYFDFIIAERGFTSSIAFQPLYSEFSGENPLFSVDDVLELEGNKIALNNIPDFILIPNVDAEIAMQRLNKRKKNDNAIYETLNFERELSKIYSGKRTIYVGGEETTFKEFLETEGKRRGIGTKYLLLSTEGNEEDTKKRVEDFFYKWIAPRIKS